jgi:hypothetical protein
LKRRGLITLCCAFFMITLKPPYLKIPIGN